MMALARAPTPRAQTVPRRARSTSSQETQRKQESQQHRPGGPDRGLYTLARACIRASIGRRSKRRRRGAGGWARQARARRGITRSPCAHDVGPDRKSVVDESQVDGFRASVRGTNGRGFGLLAFIGNLCLLVSVFSRYIVTTTVRVSRRDRTLSITSRAHRTRVQLGVSLTLTLRLSSISSCHLPFLLLASLLLSAPLPSPCCFSLSMTRLSALFSAHVQSFSALPRHPFLSPRPRSREGEIRRENSGV